MWRNLNAGDATKWTYEPDIQQAGDRRTAPGKNAGLRLTLAGLAARQDRRLVGRAGRLPAVYRRRRPRPPRVTGSHGPRAARIPEQVQPGSPGRRRSPTASSSRPTSDSTREQPGGEERNNPRDLIRVTEQAGVIPGHHLSVAELGARRHSYRVAPPAAVSYITGAHSMKAGFIYTSYRRLRRGELTRTINSSPYRFRDGIPNQLTMTAHPVDQSFTHARERRLPNIEDRSTFGRMTLDGGPALRAHRRLVRRGTARPQPLHARCPCTSRRRTAPCTSARSPPEGRRLARRLRHGEDGREGSPRPVSAGRRRVTGPTDNIGNPANDCRHDHEPGVDRREPELRARLRPSESSGAGSPHSPAATCAASGPR